MFKKLALNLFVIVSAILTAPLINAQDKLPLDAFAMKAMIRGADVSPDGKHFLMIRATNRAGFYVLEIFNSDTPGTAPITLGSDNMEIMGANWLNNKKILVSFRREVKDGATTRLEGQLAIIEAKKDTRWKQVRDEGSVRILSTLPDDPNHILISYDKDRNRYPDVLKYNINNFREKVVFYGTDEHYTGFITDKDGDIRTSSTYNPGANTITISVREKGKTDWKTLYTLDPKVKENFNILGIDGKDQNIFYVSANRGEDTEGVYTVNVKDMTYSERIFGLKSVDVGGVILSGKKERYNQLDGFFYNTSKLKRYFLNPQEKVLYDALGKALPKKVLSLNRSDKDETIIIRATGERDPGTYYLFRKQKLTLLAQNYPLQTEDKLSDVKYYSYKARDGRKIRAYVTRPGGEGPHPTIIMPHGGPWARDFGQYDDWAQLLAHHGYVVIQPQFRGSTGFGLDHWTAGDREWGLKMQDDLDDAAHDAVKRGWADKDKLAIFGWSYGGYAAFVGAMRDQNIYQCAVAGAGVSDIDKIRASTFGSRYQRIYQRTSFAGITPVDQAEKVNIPILVIHGDIDYVVPVSHSREMANKLKQYNKDYKYVEIRGLAHRSNRFSYAHKKQFYGELLNWFNTKCF